MKRLLVLLLAVAALAAQQQERPRDDKYKDDAQAYCWTAKSSGSLGPRRERDPHAHKCSCHLMCQIGESGEVAGDHEDSTCELYCTRERCFCHVEEPCEKPSGSAKMEK